MSTLLIEITNKDAYPLLKQLEKLHLIKFIRNNNHTQKLSDRFAGKLAANDAGKFQNHILNSREEWDI